MTLPDEGSTADIARLLIAASKLRAEIERATGVTRQRPGVHMNPARQMSLAHTIAEDLVCRLQMAHTKSREWDEARA